MKTCSDVETAANVLVGEIVLTALGLIVNIMGVYLGFMSICCGPWKVIFFILYNKIFRCIKLPVNKGSNVYSEKSNFKRSLYRNDEKRIII